jgi:hypothetical protein
MDIGVGLRPQRPRNWMQVLLELMEGVEDTAFRMDKLSSAMFLRQVWETGRVTDEEIRAELISLIMEILQATRTDMTPDEMLEEAEKRADEIMRMWRAEGGLRRILRRRGHELMR